jgi:hypothetical protein
LSQDEKLAKTESKQETHKHWILWTLVAVFIVASIGVMLGVDYYYAPNTAKIAPNAPDQ